MQRRGQLYFRRCVRSLGRGAVPHFEVALPLVLRPAVKFCLGVPAAHANMSEGKSHGALAAPLQRVLCTRLVARRESPQYVHELPHGSSEVCVCARGMGRGCTLTRARPCRRTVATNSPRKTSKSAPICSGAMRTRADGRAICAGRTVAAQRPTAAWRRRSANRMCPVAAYVPVSCSMLCARYGSGKAHAT